MCMFVFYLEAPDLPVCTSCTSSLLDVITCIHMTCRAYIPTCGVLSVCRPGACSTYAAALSLKKNVLRVLAPPPSPLPGVYLSTRGQRKQVERRVAGSTISTSIHTAYVQPGYIML